MSREELNVGAKIRAFRKGKGLSLVELSRRTGIAPSNLSSIELNKSSPTLGTLLKIAHAFGMRLGEWLDNALYSKAILCTGPVEKPGELAATESVAHHLTAGVTFNRMKAYIIAVSSEAPDTLPLMPGVDRLLYCLSGEITAAVDDQTYLLGTNDCLYLLPEAFISLENRSEAPSALLVVTTAHTP